MRFFGTKNIKVHVKKFLVYNAARFRQKIVLDVPAGSGISSGILHELGARVEAYDLFPEFFSVEGLSCKRADLSKGIPVSSNYADFVLCQEGIEHFPDQLAVLREFNRALKLGGSAIITTPNYSNLRSRLSYFLAESEYFFKIMPPNELDSIWMARNNGRPEIYFGHIFLVGIQKLRVLAKLAGFRIKAINHVRVNHTSLLMLPLAFPFIYIVNKLSIIRALRKNRNHNLKKKREVYHEQIKLNSHLNILVGSHLFVEFEKDTDVETVANDLQGKIKDFTEIT